MNYKKICLTIAAGSLCVSLIGCKSEISVPLDGSLLLENSKSTSRSTLSIEIPSCSEITTGLESSDLLKVKQVVPFIINNSKYISCSDNTNSFASVAKFSIPVSILPLHSDTCPANEICVWLGQDEWILSRIGDGILGKLRQVSNEIVYDISDIRLSISFANSTSARSMFFPSGYINGHQPWHFGSFSIEAAENIELTLPNSGSHLLLDGEPVKIVQLSNE